ncbi:MAG TPA: glycosyltransferase family 4 protein [Candidatus Angelobacter sp.]|nr:glycosyltransferase family 4 protein [Candidatus Angelobacter sp.]
MINTSMKRPLRILVAHNVSRQLTGGMSRLLGFMHQQIVLAGHAVDYFCAEDLPPSLKGRLARFSFPAMVFRHARAAAQAGRPYDIVNVHEPQGAVLGLLKGLAGRPQVVVTTHGVERRGWQRLLEEAERGREQVKLTSRVLFPATVLSQTRVALSHADHIFCLNSEDSEYLAANFRIPASRITRIYPAADPVYAEVAAQRDYTRKKTLLFAGTWLKRKGTLDLIAAFTALAARHSELQLVILNGGVEEAAIRASFPEEIRSRVICRRAEPEQGTAEAMAAADIYLLPSLFEGTPLTLMEAMYSGLPIVSTAVCGMKDVIEDGRNGLLVPLRAPQAIITAVERLLNDSALRARLGQAARAEALEKYNWPRVAGAVQEVYERLCP